MTITTLTPDLSVMPQISQRDVADLARRGFRSIIGNRPESEGPDQPAWADIAAAARSHGMEARHIPVVASQISDDDVVAFAKALHEMPAPAAAFCRTGTRAALLWTLANEGPRDGEERMRISASQGYDLEPFRDRIERSCPPLSKAD